MEFLYAFGRNTFSSLSVRNYRLYFFGQALSQMGNWMQTVALGWLVLQMTGSGTLLGTVLACRFFPLFVMGPLSGSLVDRFDKRALLFIAQSLLALFSLILGVLVFTGAAELWMLYVLAFLTGVVNSIDNPARQTFVHEMVGPEQLRNAVTLNATAVNLARVVGPAIAGIIIATLGIALCFFIDALSYLAIIVVLILIRTRELFREPRTPAPLRDWHAIIPYLMSNPTILGILTAMAIMGTLAYEFQVSLPLLAETTFLGGAADYAALLSAFGIGSVAGGLFAAQRSEVVPREFILFAWGFGVALCITAFMPTLGLATIGMVFVGFFSINMTTTGNTIIQLESTPEMRGRVMSLWSMAIFGSTLIGAPIIGFLGEHLSPRYGLFVGGASAIVAALYAGGKLLGREGIIPVPYWLQIRRQEVPSANTKL